MIVAEFIELLKQQPQDIKVAYMMHSEQCLLAPEQISVAELCHPRSDSWVENKRPDKETELYLLLPGN